MVRVRVRVRVWVRVRVRARVRARVRGRLTLARRVGEEDGAGEKRLDRKLEMLLG